METMDQSVQTMSEAGCVPEGGSIELSTNIDKRVVEPQRVSDRAVDRCCPLLLAGQLKEPDFRRLSVPKSLRPFPKQKSLLNNYDGNVHTRIK